MDRQGRVGLPRDPGPVPPRRCRARHGWSRHGWSRTDPTALPRADLLLARFTLVAIGDPVIESASRLPARTPGSLDAVPLATALLLGSDLEEFVTYAGRFAQAASAQGIRTASPASG